MANGLRNVEPPPRGDRRRRYSEARARKMLELLELGRGWVSDAGKYPTRPSAAGQAVVAANALERYCGVEREQLEQRTWGENGGWRWALRLKRKD